MRPSVDTIAALLKRSLRRPISGRRGRLFPETLFHYTTAAGFEGIVRTGSLRATNFSYLNDPSEVDYGTKIVGHAMFQGFRQGDATTRACVERIDAHLSRELLSETYLCCFTGLRDHLSQWRAYGGGGHERYSIGFNGEGIRSWARSLKNAQFVQVIYQPAVQEQRIKQILETTFTVARTNRLEGDDIEPLAEVAAERLARTLPLFKSPAYVIENEWRIVVCNFVSEIDDIEVDTSRGVLRPYVTLPFPRDESLPISEVWVLAPTRTATALKAARIVLARKGISQVQPRSSNVPFTE